MRVERVCGIERGGERVGRHEGEEKPKEDRGDGLKKGESVWRQRHEGEDILVYGIKTVLSQTNKRLPQFGLSLNL